MKQKSNKKPTVTVAICAYNEANNIRLFLNSVLDQKEKGYMLKSILVISDGSTDETSQKVKKIHNKKINLIMYEKRLGKSTRLNEIYKRTNTDILIQSDSDVIFSHPYVIAEAVNILTQSDEVAMCGGNPTPLPATSFTEKAVNCTVLPYLRFRKKIKKGNNVFSADGRFLGFKKRFYKKLIIPGDMIANDMFAYFTCISNKLTYRFAEKAVVYFRSPGTLPDHIKQNTRFVASPIRMTRYFSESLVKSELSIPFLYLIKEYVRIFVQHPILCFYIFFINYYCRANAFLSEKNMTAKWPMAISTKMLEGDLTQI